jgi:hypothetical protein
MAYTIEEKINIAKISQYLTARDVRNGSLFGATLNPNLPQILYIERKSVEWAFDKNPANSTLTGTSNYLLSLCNNAKEAAQILSIGGGGQVVAPGNPDSNTPYLIQVYPTPFDGTKGFTDVTHYDNEYLVGKNLVVWMLSVPKELESPEEYVSTATGINILIDSFDAADYPQDKVLFTIFIY